MPETKNIVVVGGSFAGLSVAHYFLRQINPLLKAKNERYSLVLINPSTHFFWRPGAPRSVVDASLLRNERMFTPIVENFTQYGKDFVFHQGTVTSVDTSERNVTYKPEASEETVVLSYHALVIASGSQTPSSLTSIYGSHTATMEAFAEMNRRLKVAKSVIVSGGGPTGVETAGEIGYILNGRSSGHFFSSRPATPNAKVTLLTASDKLLPVLRPTLAKQAEIYLNELGIEVLYNTRIVKTSTDSDNGKATLTLADGSTLEADIYIPAGGVRPNTAFLPQDILNEKGYVLATTATTRVEGAGKRTYAVGDVACFASGGLLDLDSSVAALGSSLARDLGLWSFPEKLHVQDTSESQGTPIGRSKGVGAIKGWKIPSWLVSLMKKNYMIEKRMEFVQGTKYKFAVP